MRGGADRVRVADRLNVAERLAEGRPAAEHTQSYVRACHLVGYQHPDLTAYPAQIHDWYGSEDGLDLHALDADCAQLRAAASVLMEALRMERSQVAVLAAAWTGSGADAAVHFVQRHCETGNSVVTEVRAAAQRCESLRDNLWQLVDSKVATAIAIDERALAQRPAWLAAAEALTTEGADRPTAVEVVRQQIQPYVDDDVRNDWLTRCDRQRPVWRRRMMRSPISWPARRARTSRFRTISGPVANLLRHRCRLNRARRQRLRPRPLFPRRIRCRP